MVPIVAHFEPASFVGSACARLGITPEPIATRLRRTRNRTVLMTYRRRDKDMPLLHNGLGSRFGGYSSTAFALFEVHRHSAHRAYRFSVIALCSFTPVSSRLPGASTLKGVSSACSFAAESTYSPNTLTRGRLTSQSLVPLQGPIHPLDKAGKIQRRKVQHLIRHRQETAENGLSCHFLFVHGNRIEARRQCARSLK